MIKKLISNSISNVSVLILKVCITFVMSPVIVSSLGNYDYGIWEIVFGIVGYMGLLDIGIPTAIVRYVAKFNAENDKEKLERLYSTTLLYMGSTGLFLCLFFLSWAIFFPEYISKHSEMTNKYIWFVIIIGFQLMMTFPGYVFQSVHQGFQRYSLLNMITIMNSIIGAFITYHWLTRGGGIVALALVQGIGLSVKFIIYWLLLRLNRFGGFRFYRYKASWQFFKELLVFGVKNLIIGISIQISMSTGPLIIGYFLGPAIVTFYVIPIGLIRHAMNIISSLTLSFLPAFSDLNARKAYNEISDLYLNASRWIVGFVFPVIIGICFMGKLFIARWMGPEYAEKGQSIIYIITFAYSLTYFNPFSNRFLTGVDKQEILAKLRMFSAVVNFTLSLILVRFWGKEGVALAILIPSCIVEPIILYSVCRHLRISMAHYVKSVYFPLILPSISIGLYLFNAVSFYECKTYLEIILISFSAMIVYGISFYLVGLKKSEKQMLIRALKKKFKILFDFLY